MKKEKKILLTAYAVNPYKGSEDGTGWNISKELAKTHPVSVITRKNNREEIERYLAEVNDPIHKNMSFYYHDLPTWVMRLKKKLGERGYVLYYYFWQLFLPLFVKRNKISFDIAHAVNFHSDSHPQFLWTLRKPVFWGPIGHHPPVPKPYLKPIYGKKNWLKDRIYNTVKFIMRNLDPFFYISKWTAKKIFVINTGVNKVVRAKKDKVIILPAVAHEPDKTIPTKESQEKFTVLSVGRFVYMKGFDITILAFAAFYHKLPKQEQIKTCLKLVGKGEELAHMQKLIKSAKIEQVTEIIQWVPKNEMKDIYQNASVFCFGSHEGAGMVVPEALGYGLPVVCFDNYGPGELCNDNCAIRIPYSTYEESIFSFSNALSKLHSNKEAYKELSVNAQEFASEQFTWTRKASIINSAYALH